MPSPEENMRIKDIDPKKDGRVKLTPRQKNNIRKLRELQGLSNMALANKYKVSKRTIQFILDPQKLEENKKRRAERGGSKIYYDTDKHREYMSKHRARKMELILDKVK